jgi:glutathione reductase (NADPH)
MRKTISRKTHNTPKNAATSLARRAFGSTLPGRATTWALLAGRGGAVAPRNATLHTPSRRALHLAPPAAEPSSSSSYDYDLFAIGAGSGGVRATRWAAATYGIKAAVAEMPYARVPGEGDLGGAGGTCVLRGCVPKKLLVFGSEFSDAFTDAAGFGWKLPGDGSARPVPDWPALQTKVSAELTRLNGIYSSLLGGAGVDLIEGRGRLVDAHTVAVGDKTYTARHILIATGGRPHVPSFPGSDLCITSDDALALPALPSKIAIIGGGYIAVEFASIFHGFGVDTHLVFRQALPLGGFDGEVRTFAMEQYADRGLAMHPSNTPTAVERAPDGSLTLSLEGADGSITKLEGLSHVMAATGRRPNTAGLGLDAVGVKTDDWSGAVVVDAHSRTSVPGVWAVGDVTDRVNLTPVALMEGMAFARAAFGPQGLDTPGAKLDHENIASAVFSNPPIASVGLTEEAAVEQCGTVDVYTSAFRPMKNTVSGATGRFFMKILVNPATDAVLGIHMVGPDAGEIMQGFAVGMKLGMTKAQLDSVVGIHPTAAEELVTMRSRTRVAEKK